MELPPKLKEYIDNNRGSLPPVTDPDEPLQLDSLGLVRLVAFLENDIGYRIEDEELVAENFATVRDDWRVAEGQSARRFDKLILSSRQPSN